VRERRGRGEPVIGVDQQLHAVGREHLDGRDPGRLGQRVRVLGDEQRAVDALTGPVLADGLAGGGDVIVVERGLEGRPAVP